MRLLFVMAGEEAFIFSAGMPCRWPYSEGTVDMPLVSLRCSGDKCGLYILYSHGYWSPGLSVFALLTDTSSVMQTRPRKSAVYHKDHSQLCISWSTSIEGEPLPEMLIHCWLVQWVIYHVKVGVLHSSVHGCPQSLPLSQGHMLSVCIAFAEHTARY